MVPVCIKGLVSRSISSRAKNASILQGVMVKIYVTFALKKNKKIDLYDSHNAAFYIGSLYWRMLEFQVTFMVTIPNKPAGIIVMQHLPRVDGLVLSHFPYNTAFCIARDHSK